MQASRNGTHILQAYQGALEAGHWLYQAKCSKWTRLKVEQRTAQGKGELPQEARHPFGLRKSAGISMDRKKHAYYSMRGNVLRVSHLTLLHTTEGHGQQEDVVSTLSQV